MPINIGDTLIEIIARFRPSNNTSVATPQGDREYCAAGRLPGAVTAARWQCAASSFLQLRS